MIDKNVIEARIKTLDEETENGRLELRVLEMRAAGLQKDFNDLQARKAWVDQQLVRISGARQILTEMLEQHFPEAVSAITADPTPADEPAHTDN